MPMSINSVPKPMEWNDLHLGSVSIENFIDRVGYSTNTLLDFKAFQHLEILGNKLRTCVKGADKLFYELVDEIRPIQ